MYRGCGGVIPLPGVLGGNTFARAYRPVLYGGTVCMGIVWLLTGGVAAKTYWRLRDIVTP